MIKKQKIHLVTGKGGVGKSTVAAGLAFYLSSLGGKTLLVELGERSFFASSLGADFTFEPRQIEGGVWVSRWQPEECLKEYLGYLLKIKSLAQLFFENHVMRALVQSAPALKELAISGKLTSGPRGVGPSMDFDHIILDAYSTGHFKALMNASVGMAEAVGFGPMGEQSRGITEVLSDSNRTSIYAVAIPEELPVKEALELKSFLHSNFRQNPVVIMNKAQIPRIPLSEMKALSQEVPNDRYLKYLEQRGRAEGEAIQNLGERSICLKNHFTPASKKLYQLVGQELGGQLEP